LSQVSGYSYRLPTDEEWLLAARAGSDWDSKDATCGTASTGFGRLVRGDEWSSKGVTNPWGLVDMVGGIWEWTTTGTTLAVRGGSYRSGPDACSVTSTRTSDGSAERDVGFRLVRDIQ
jgi:non-specific serine/threonine protein kinase